MDLLLSKQPNLKFTSALPEDDESRARCLRMRDEAQKSSDAFALSLQKVFEEYQQVLQSRADMFVETEKLRRDVTELSEKCEEKESAIKRMSNELADVIIREPKPYLNGEKSDKPVENQDSLHNKSKGSSVLVDDTLLSPKIEIFSCDFESDIDDFQSPIKTNNSSTNSSLKKTSSAGFLVRQPSNLKNASKTDSGSDILNDNSKPANTSGTAKSISEKNANTTPVKAPLRNIANSPEILSKAKQGQSSSLKAAGTLSFSSLYGGETKFINGKKSKQTKLMLLPTNKKTDLSLSSKNAQNENSLSNDKIWDDMEFNDKLHTFTKVSKNSVMQKENTEKNKASSSAKISEEPINKFISDGDDSMFNDLTMFNEITMFHDNVKSKNNLFVKNQNSEPKQEAFNIMKSKSWDSKSTTLKLDKNKVPQEQGSAQKKEALEIIKSKREKSPDFSSMDGDETMFDQVNVTPISKSSRLRKKLKKINSPSHFINTESSSTFRPKACSTQFGDCSDNKSARIFERDQLAINLNDVRKCSEKAENVKSEKDNRQVNKRKYEEEPQNTFNDETYFTYAEDRQVDKNKPNTEVDSDVEIEFSVVANNKSQTPKAKKVLLSSFDRIPGRETISPEYVYKEDPVRKKSERARLLGHDCPDCEAYFKHLPEKERQARLNACSRHRSRFKRSAETPESFWDPGFPETPAKFREKC